MKKNIFIVLLIQAQILSASWIIVRVDNQSDLIFKQAVRKNEVEIQSVSQNLIKKDQKKIKVLPHSNIIYLDKSMLFGSNGGCKIIAETPQGHAMQILFFGDYKHKVSNGRALLTDVDSRLAAESLKDLNKPMMARVFTHQKNNNKLIGYADYLENGQEFSLILMGSDGNYKADLTMLKSDV